jgi:hypothetical protein
MSLLLLARAFNFVSVFLVDWTFVVDKFEERCYEDALTVDL